jgi:hypothetical protein
MNVSIRLVLDSAGRILGYQELHPDTSAGGTAASARVKVLVARGNELVEQEFAGHRAVKGAVINKVQLRGELVQTVAVLSGIARSIARQEPDLAPGIPMPGRRDSDKAFLGRSRDALAAATAKKDVFLKYGMPETLVEDLGALIQRYEAVVSDKHAGQAAHIGARAELRAVAAELVSLMHQLDAINTFRFRNDPQALEAWRAARKVAWPAGSKSVAAAVEKPAA